MNATGIAPRASTSAPQIEGFMRGLAKQASIDADTDLLIAGFNDFKATGQRTIPALVLSVYCSLVQEVKALRRRVAELEARKGGIRYCGVHRPGQVYRVGDVVTFGASMWVCRSDTTDTPGEGATSWQLAVKRGRNGRDAREHGREAEQ
jgi:hypothetical protein